MGADVRPEAGPATEPVTHHPAAAATEPATPDPARSRAARRVPWYRRPTVGTASLLVVLVVALLFGSGVGGSGRQSDAARAAALDSQVKCPSCDDLSVAESSASAAVAVRRQIQQEVKLGWSNTRIEDTLVAHYGPTILLRPPTSGLTSLVWILPVVGGVVAVSVLGTLFWRRSRQLRLLRAGPP